MTTDAQRVGFWGEAQVAKHVRCPVCHSPSLSPLAQGFPSLDLVCRACGAYMAQVKATTLKPGADPSTRPATIRGAGWRPLQRQIALGQLRDLYVVGAYRRGKGFKLAFIDLIPGAVLMSNLGVFQRRTAIIGQTRKHEMFNIHFDQIPKAGIVTLFQMDSVSGTGST